MDSHNILLGLFAGAFVAAYLAFIDWVVRDAQSRGKPGWAVGLLVLLTFPWGLILWGLFRPAKLPPPSNEARFDLESFRVQ